MYLGASAQRLPDKTALIFPERDRVVTYRELEERSNRVAQALRAWGLKPGDGIAVVLANEPAFFDVYWGAIRAGIYFTPVNWHLSPDEIQYVVQNSDAKALFANAAFASVSSGSSFRASL